MKYKSKSIPVPYEGQSGFPPKLVQPNQSMSLEEILERFTRGEPVAIGRDVQYHESDDDLEKVSNMDLVDKAEYVDKLKQTQKNYEKQERKKAKAEKERLEKIALDKIEQEHRQKKADEAGGAK